jgi:glycosyltransferase involved in cell wall biosynthesis
MASGFRLQGIRTLAQLIKKGGIDVVHSHDDRPLIHAAPAAVLAGAGLVHTRHGQSIGLSRRQLRLISLGARLSGFFVCVSADSTRLAIEQGIAPNKLRTIWNGVDLDHYTYAGPVSGGPITCVARLSPEKGVDTLIRAAALAVRQNPLLRFQIAGDGICRPMLQQLIAELGLTRHVDLLGQVRDIKTLLDRASLFVLPSRSEGISLTLLEAMARGLPVVATHVGGNSEVVIPGETGLLVPPEDAEALTVALLQLQRQPEEAWAMGRAGRRRVECYFDIRRMVAAYEALYAACCRWSLTASGHSRYSEKHVDPGRSGSNPQRLDPVAAISQRSEGPLAHG